MGAGVLFPGPVKNLSPDEIGAIASDLMDHVGDDEDYRRLAEIFLED